VYDYPANGDFYSVLNCTQNGFFTYESVRFIFEAIEDNPAAIPQRLTVFRFLPLALTEFAGLHVHGTPNLAHRMNNRHAVRLVDKPSCTPLAWMGLCISSRCRRRDSLESAHVSGGLNPGLKAAIFGPIFRELKLPAPSGTPVCNGGANGVEGGIYKRRSGSIRTDKDRRLWIAHRFL
jgi:hypothetical protein